MLTMNSRGGGAGTGSAAAGRPTGRNARLSKAVMAKVDRVMEVCSVPFDEAHRVLQDNGMDVQRTIERFVSGTLIPRPETSPIIVLWAMLVCFSVDLLNFSMRGWFVCVDVFVRRTSGRAIFCGCRVLMLT